MVDCYHSDVKFKDPAFGELSGDQVFYMWKMLLERGGDDLKISFNNVKETTLGACADWKAEYRFGSSKRKVINRIHAEFQVMNGKIIVHHDHFDIWKWSSQALGFSGSILGWLPFFQNQIRNKSNSTLERYMDRQSS